MCDDNGNLFIVTLRNVLLAPDLRESLFSNIMLMNWVHTCLFHKWFCTVEFGDKEKNTVDWVQTNMSPTISLSSMYQEPFIYRRNRTNSQ